MDQDAKQGQGEKSPDDAIEQGVARCAEHIGIGQDDAVEETKALVFFLLQVAIEASLERAVGRMAGQALPLGLVLGQDLVREGLGRRGVAVNAAHGVPVQAGIGQPLMDAVDIGARLGGAGCFLRGELREGLVGVVAVEAVAVVLSHDPARINQAMGDQVAVWVVATRTGEFVLEPDGMHRGVELLLDAHDLAGMALGAVAAVFPSCVGVWVSVVRPAVALMAGYLAVIRGLVGVWGGIVRELGERREVKVCTWRLMHGLR